MNNSHLVAAALIAWSASVTATLNAGNVSWGVSVGSWGGGIGVGVSAGSGGGHGGGYPPPPPYNPVRTTIVQCDSNLKLFNSCEVGGQIIDVQLVNQRSNSPCELGRSWGYDHSRVWVDRGCRASFRVTVR